jgi:hypothetical protein
MVSYREAAEVLWGEAGAYAHDAYQRYLHLYPGLPAEVPIVIGITAYGRCLGLTRTAWLHGPRISLFSSNFGQGTRIVDDTMIHEMLHIWLAETGQEIGHDTEAWYAAVSRLSPEVLGHDLDARRHGSRRSVRVPNPDCGQPGQPKTLVRKVRRDNAILHRDIARWPLPFRPSGTPAGRPIPCPTY